MHLKIKCTIQLPGDHSVCVLWCVSVCFELNFVCVERSKQPLVQLGQVGQCKSHGTEWNIEFCMQWELWPKRLAETNISDILSWCCYCFTKCSSSCVRSSKITGCKRKTVDNSHQIFVSLSVAPILSSPFGYNLCAIYTMQFQRYKNFYSK